MSSCEASGSSSDHSQENCPQRQCSELACLWREEGWTGRREGEGSLGRVFAWVVTVSLILTVWVFAWVVTVSLILTVGVCMGSHSESHIDCVGVCMGSHSESH